MSCTTVKRKVVRWVSFDPPRQWTAHLTCGHPVRQYDEPFDDEGKARVEKDGGVECYECGEKKDRIAMLKMQLADLEQEQ